MTSICCAQLVERGLVTLDEPIYKHIPELKDLPVLTGFNEDGSPIETPHKNAITLRLLLSHSSGLSYDVMHPLLAAWLKAKNLEPAGSGKLIERFTRAPLVFEPGTSWSYGPSIDFAGLLVERISGKSLEEYMRENLWEPLGVKDMTFHLSKRPDLAERKTDMSARDPSSGKVVNFPGRMPYQTGDGGEIEDCLGGQGVFSNGDEYIKILHGLLTTDENEKILKKETVELFFSPQLGEGSSAMLNMILQDDAANNAMGGVPKTVKKDWGLGGLLICGDTPDGKREGTMFWGGYPNLIWFCDRKTGITGIFSAQVVPPGDAKCADLTRQFQAGVYELYKKSRSVSLLG
jgi:CubicO group peptidase (beta-lactamase class C family)